MPDWFDVIDGTWPAAVYSACGPFTLRQGQGGGSRVSAATLSSTATDADIDAAETEMMRLNGKRIFMIRPGDEDLDNRLAARGYEVKDPVTIYACPVGQLTDIPIPRVTVFCLWEPLAIMREIWAAGDIGPARLAIMNRVQGPKTAMLARHRDKPGGTAFLAVRGEVAMLHALEILPHQRRQGLGQWVMRAAAFWAMDNGATTLSVMCTRENTGANALYHSLGMDPVSHYHYRTRH